MKKKIRKKEKEELSDTYVLVNNNQQHIMHKVCVFEQLIKTEWREKKNKDQHDLTATLIDLLKKVRGRIALN